MYTNNDIIEMRQTIEAFETAKREEAITEVAAKLLPVKELVADTELGALVSDVESILESIEDLVVVKDLLNNIVVSYNLLKNSVENLEATMIQEAFVRLTEAVDEDTE